MLDQFIKDKADLISYNQTELSNIATTLSNLKDIINNDPDYRAPFLGGSYKRGTMVKGVSDVDVYFHYTGSGNPQSALDKLKKCLTLSYPTSEIRQDKPSILAEFKKIPINITPYKKDNWERLSIPDKYLLNWEQINFGELETAITALRQKNPKYIDLIKILKLWNFNYKRGIKNFEIERSIVNIYLYNNPNSQSIFDWIWTFIHNTGCITDSNRFYTLKSYSNNTALQKSEWLKFIDNK